ncbi:MAG: AmmeMemoRadiSam system protein B [Phycisphaeraceae bacterium]
MAETSADSTQAMHVRPAAVAGRFYPADPKELSFAVWQLIEAARASVHAVEGVKAIIGPHAGYIYSGPVAGSAYAALPSTLKGKIARVVLIGPSHFVNFTGIATTSDDAFITPLGEVMIDREALDAASSLSFVQTFDEAHEKEHGLEVHLPFLQVALGSFKLAPFVFSDSSAAECGELLEKLWGGPETLIVISSDLSHYHDYATARQIDMSTCAAIEAQRPDQIGENQACGRLAVQGLLLAANERKLKTRTLDLRNSGDTAGPRSRVVGYGAWALS